MIWMHAWPQSSQLLWHNNSFNTQKHFTKIVKYLSVRFTAPVTCATRWHPLATPVPSPATVPVCRAVPLTAPACEPPRVPPVCRPTLHRRETRGKGSLERTGGQRGEDKVGLDCSVFAYISQYFIKLGLLGLLWATFEGVIYPLGPRGFNVSPVPAQMRGPSPDSSAGQKWPPPPPPLGRVPAREIAIPTVCFMDTNHGRKETNPDRILN